MSKSMRYKRGARTKHKAVLKFIVESSEKKYKRQGGESLILFLLPTIFQYQRVLWLNPSRLLHTTQLLLTFPREMGEGTRRALARNSCIEIEAVELRQAKQNKEFSHRFPPSAAVQQRRSHHTSQKTNAVTPNAPLCLPPAFISAPKPHSWEHPCAVLAVPPPAPGAPAACWLAGSASTTRPWLCRCCAALCEPHCVSHAVFHHKSKIQQPVSNCEDYPKEAQHKR